MPGVMLEKDLRNLLLEAPPGKAAKLPEIHLPRSSAEQYFWYK
jgi:hypothetical protein